MNSHSSRPEGVALLEVLLAVTMIGIGLGAVFSSFSDTTRLRSLLEREATARHLASGQLHELRISGALRQTGETSGRFEAPYTDYSWNVRVRSASGPSPFSRARIVLTHGEKNKEIYSLQTYLLRP